MALRIVAKRELRRRYWQGKELLHKYPKQVYLTVFVLATVMAILGPLAAREFQDVLPLPRVLLGWFALVGGISVPVIGFIVLLWDSKDKS